jgi:hypothetical protein
LGRSGYVIADVYGDRRGNHSMKCSTCASELTQKNRVWSFAAGVVMVASVGMAFVSAVFWLPGFVFGLIGGYVVLWSTLGLWCRTCKRAPLFP